MRYLKNGTCKASNFACNPREGWAISYGHWHFVKRVPMIGLVFNSYRYSVTTQAHQRKAREELKRAGYVIALEVNTVLSLDAPFKDVLRATIKHHETLAEQISDRLDGCTRRIKASTLEMLNAELVAHLNKAMTLESLLTSVV